MLPYLVGNVVELLDVEPEDGQEEDGGNTDLDSERKGKCAVIKTVSQNAAACPPPTHPLTHLLTCSLAHAHTLCHRSSTSIPHPNPNSRRGRPSSSR